MDSYFPVLVAEDSPDDQLLIRRAISKTGAKVSLYFVESAQDALDYLAGRGRFANRNEFPFPSCILTDLKMPGGSGFDILEWLQNHPECRVIPVLVLTSSSQPQDIERAYKLGANSYFVKPVVYSDLEALFSLIVSYWRVAARPNVHDCT